MADNQIKRNTDFDSSNLISFIWKWRIPLIIIVVIAALAAVIFSAPFFITPKFKSTVVLFPTSTNSISKVLLSDNFGGKEDILEFGEEEQAEQLLQILNSTLIRAEIIDKYNQGAIEARDKGAKVAWVCSNFPAEILHAMDIIPVYPENLAVQVLVKRKLVELSDVAEELGYTRDICSYARCNLGSLESGISPIGPIPQPDLLCVNLLQCFQMMKWFEVVSRHFNIPLFVIDPGIVTDYKWDEVVIGKEGTPSSGRAAKKYVKEQLEDLVALMEETTGRKMDYDYLREVLNRSNRARKLWLEIMESAVNIPSPISAFDIYIAVAVIFSMRGSQEAIDYYEKVKAEIDERIAQKIPAVPGEKLRLHFEPMPLYYSLRADRDFFASHGANILTNSYPFMYVKQFDDLSDPLGSLATESEYCALSCWGSVARAKFITELIKKFHLDGFLLHSARTCKNSTAEYPHIAKLVTEKTGIPGLVFEADHGDPRLYSEEDIRGLWEQYLTMLSERKT